MIKPLPGYCVIEPIEDEDKSAGGVYLPESSKDKPSKGKVLATGLAYLHESGVNYMSPVKSGQTVIYKKWSNQEVVDDGKTYLMVHFNELMGVVE